MSTGFKTFRNPYFQERLSTNSETSCFLVNFLDNPKRKVYINPLCCLLRTTSFAQVQMRGDILAILKFFIKIDRFHKVPPLLFLIF